MENNKYTFNYDFTMQQQLMNEGTNYSFFENGLIALKKIKDEMYLVYYSNPPKEYGEFSPNKKVKDDDV